MFLYELPRNSGDVRKGGRIVSWTLRSKMVFIIDFFPTPSFPAPSSKGLHTISGTGAKDTIYLSGRYQTLQQTQEHRACKATNKQRASILGCTFQLLHTYTQGGAQTIYRLSQENLLDLVDNLAGLSQRLDHLLALLPPPDGVFALLEQLVEFFLFIHLLEEFLLHFLLGVSVTICQL